MSTRPQPQQLGIQGLGLDGGSWSWAQALPPEEVCHQDPALRGEMAKWIIKVATPQQSTRRGAKSQNYKQNREELCWMRNESNDPVKKKGQITEAKHERQSPKA